MYKGYNSRLDEIHAAVLIERLKKLDEWNTRRQSIADLYLDNLNSEKFILPPSCHSFMNPAWHLFVIRHQARDELQRYLTNHQINTIIH